MVKQFIWILFAMLLIGLSGCFQCSHSNGGKATPILEVIYRGIDCERTESEAGAVWISNRQQLVHVYDQVNKSVIGSAQDKLPNIDFSRFGVLMIMMGQRPTSGFRLQRGEKHVLIKDDTAKVYIQWVEPPKDAILPQMTSSPCLMLKLPKGGYSQIHVLDQNGRLRAEVDQF
jgi:hypothetical protein